MRIFSDDGKHEFKTIDECKTWEKEELEKKAKAEAERKEKAEAKEKAMRWVTESLELVNQAVERYENETGKQLEVYVLNGKLTARERVTTNSCSYIPWYLRV